MGKVDEIKSAITTHDLLEQITGQPLKAADPQGRSMGLCPFHADTHESLRLFDDGGFNCFTCGAKGGDVIDFYMMHNETGKVETIREMHRLYVGEGVAPPRAAKPRKGPQLRNEIPQAPVGIMIPEADIPKPGQMLTLHHPDKKPTKAAADVVHVYRNREGQAHHLVLRLNRGARKTFLPTRLCQGSSGLEWWNVSQDQPRQLYGLEYLDQSKQVLLVEGEKAADAARERLPDFVAVMTWPGGGNSVGTVDWSEMSGRHVVMWPDNDAPGLKAMNTVGKRLAGDVSGIKIVDTQNLGEKDDAADLHPDFGMLDWIKDHVEPWMSPDDAEEAVLQEKVVEQAAVEAEPDDGGSTFNPDEVKKQRNAQFPFHILGQHAGHAYFLKRNDGRVIDIPLSGLSRADSLRTLASSSVWKKAFGGMVGEGDNARPIGWPSICASAQDHVMEAVEHLPEYDPDRTRGRGAWPHHDLVAFNRGDLVEVEGNIETENYIDGIVYERRPALPSSNEALSNEDGSALLNVIEQCSWLESHAAMALAGWIALAPIGGALPWRPHIWITGPTGSGKSTVLDEIVLAAIGPNACLRFAGNTTEGGLRQTVKRDALPILLDEAESDARSMAAILDLARSSSTGDTIVRGTAQGGAIFYHIRSAFCFSSINPAIAKASDESRITRLALRRTQGEDADIRYLSMRDDLANILDPTFGARLSRRMINLSRIVLKNIEAVEDAVTLRFGSRRLAQQWGALLAGVHSLTSDAEVSEAQASALAEIVPDGTARLQLEEDDSFSMINHLSTFMLDMPTKAGKTKVSVVELVDRLALVMSMEGAADMRRDDAEDVLARYGIKVVDEPSGSGYVKMIAVSAKHPQLVNGIFSGTPWQHSYTDRFRDLPDSKASRGRQLRFAGRKSGFTLVPVTSFTGEE